MGGESETRARGEKGIESKSTTINNITTTTDGLKGDGYQTPIARTKRIIWIPDSDSSPERDAGDLNNLGRRNIGNGGDDPSDGSDNNGQDAQTPDRRRLRDNGDDDNGREFRLVNLRNVSVTPFTGKNLQANPYIKFNNHIRRLILTLRSDGEELVAILNKVEKFCNNKYTLKDLAKLAKDAPEAREYDRSIKAELLNRTSGIAQGLIEYGTEGGFDAWRKLYNKYVPLADDMQNILIRQLMSIKPLGEGEMDNLFDEIERIREQYVKVGSKEGPMNVRWIKAIISQNLPDNVVQALAIDLK